MKHNSSLTRKGISLNIGYYFVHPHKMAFNHISEAEEYCSRNGIDMDSGISSGNNIVLRMVKSISTSDLYLLKDILYEIEQTIDRKKVLYDIALLEFERSKKKRDLEREYKKDKVKRMGDELIGLYDTAKVLQQRIINTERLLNRPMHAE